MPDAGTNDPANLETAGHPPNADCSAIESALSIPIAHYAMYKADALIVKIYENWRGFENQLGQLIDILFRYDLFESCRMELSIMPDYSTEVCLKFSETYNEFTKFLNLFLDFDKLPTPTPIGILVLRRIVSYIVTEYYRRVYRYQAKFEQEMKLGRFWWPIGEVRLLQANMIVARLNNLEPIIQSLREKRETRESKSPLDGGRLRDAGVWPLLRAATAAGVDMPQLAKYLVKYRLDRKPLGTQRQRIFREAKRLGQALRTMKRLEPAFPSAENL